MIRRQRAVYVSAAISIGLAVAGCAEPSPIGVADGGIPPDLVTVRDLKSTDLVGADLKPPPDLFGADLKPISCVAGQKECNGKCILSSACCTAADCGPAPTNGSWSCSTSNQCQVMCNAGYSACGMVCIYAGGGTDGGAPDDMGTGGGSDGGTLPPGACMTGQMGICAIGAEACDNGQVVCMQTVQPQTERCNGVDDDCDGVADNGNPEANQPCMTGKMGVCGTGATACMNGGVVCTETVQPTTEKCNGLDDDCDGVVDNGGAGGGQACSTGKMGVCAAGTTSCAGGMLSCVQTTQPSAETCDGKDNDCNGKIDDNVSFPESIPNSCGAAGSLVVNVAPGASQDRTGHIDPAGDDFFTVTFTGVGGAGAGYHPKIDLVDTAGGQYAMFVYNQGSCGTNAQCGKTITTFEMLYPNNPNNCLANNVCSDNTPRIFQFVVRVTRPGGPPTSCATYTVRASNI